ncbi:uncharacterized protein STEHIDRAFT_170545 [Stereum hirsutum FP-91666 SS1]|uniref:uncharacterized protein n=1 Tax=Stereum hirsutum (strain FP-91666) TaxID=721885 RepID=UPI0004449297|nr:uncharacterized protein STEHIDRAFT_170545 [Stereum hirsutum FP-91666 SS1]EIM83211.1 hypothetical protein STEHIDRAFT_170545 [Stereum hirsutum FP-91666 SS1]
MTATEGVKQSVGAILLGCLISCALSGIVATETFMYFRLYRKDRLTIKAVVVLVWTLDAVHTVLACDGLWDSLILNYGNPEMVDFIPRGIGLTVAFTAIVTFIVHLFFSWRLFKLSKGNWFLATPLALLALARLVAALVSTSEMLRVKSFSAFAHNLGWCFTLGLSISCAVDVLIVLSMCFYLRTSRTGFKTVDHIIDMIMLYTFNNGSITCVATVLSLIFWLTMPDNLIFFGLHFTITKLYAISLLSTLNTRKSLLEWSHPSTGDNHEISLPIRFPGSIGSRADRTRFEESLRLDDPTATHVSINVEKTIQYDISDARDVDAEAGDPSEPRVSITTNASTSRSGFRPDKARASV